MAMSGKRITMGLLLGVMILLTLGGCNKRKITASDQTGWNYNDPKFGGFEVVRATSPITEMGWRCLSRAIRSSWGAWRRDVMFGGTIPLAA